jgi:Lanthionine synthetase C-like protein/Protein kinase domain
VESAHNRGPGQPDTYGADQSILEDLVRAALDRRSGAQWQLHGDGFWCRLQPADHVERIQGWKLHVSATPLSAAFILARVAPILIAQGCAFKFAHTLDNVYALVDTRASRGSGGKFVTAYPNDDDHLRVVSELLDEATYGLAGPSILSDRPVHPGSRVFYRYGAFQGIRHLTNDGTFDVMLAGPQGEPVKDQRQAWFSPPSWVPRPFPSDPASATARKRPEAVVLADRFIVRTAIQHANKGGVYRAQDRQTGETVILKQARAHVGSELTGLDARDTLRREADMLDRLHGDGLAPRRISLFESGDSVFLAEELIEGQGLDVWVYGCLGRAADRGIATAQARRVAGDLVDLVSRVHALGLVLRDLKPNNLIMMPDGRLQLIDPEYVEVPGTPSVNALTPGFAAPELLGRARIAPAPQQTVDLYSLGATMFFLVSGSVPFLVPDDLPARSYADRLTALVDAASVSNAALRYLAPVITGLMRDEPDERWELARVREFLDREPARVLGGVHPNEAPDAAALRDRLLRDGIEYLCESADFAAPGGPWTSGPFGLTTDRVSVQHGAAGVITVLTRAAAELEDDRALTVVRQGARWLAQRVQTLPRLLPGLLFGSSGSAIALYEAARLLGDADLAEQALDLILRISLDWDNPDVCHGLAGAGLAHLRLWQASSDPRLLPRVRLCADTLAAAAQFGPHGVFWPIPENFDSQLAGLVNYGFGHGVAGVAAFLLAAGRETGTDSYTDLAREAGQTLVTAADVQDGLVLWPAERGGDAGKINPMRLHWCNGASGIGTFLIQLWQATGEEQFGRLARQAGQTVRVNRWQHSPTLCHGLAGGGEFLLDLHRAFPDGGHRQAAEQVAEALVSRNVLRGGRLVLADETAMRIVADYGTGLAGALGFLLRLRTGRDRLLFPVDRSIQAPDGPAHASAAPALVVA